MSRTRRARGVAAAATGTLFLVVALAIATTAWWPVYEHPRLVLVAAATISVGTLLALVAAALRWPVWALALATFAAFLAVGVPLAVPAQAASGWLPTPAGLRDLVAGVALGWKQLLTISLPVGEYQALLVPFFALLLIATVTGVRMAVAGRGGEWGMLAPVVVYVAGIAFGSGDALWPAQTSLALLSVALLWLAWRRWRRRRAAVRDLIGATSDGGAPPAPRPGRRAVSGTGTGRSVVVGSVILAIAAAASLGATTTMPPTGDREVLRETVERPFDPRRYASPLSGFRRYLHPESVDAAQLVVTGMRAGDRIRVATLDSYDGVVFAVGSAGPASDSGTFERVPGRIDRDGLEGDRRRLEVEIGAYEGVWLPTVGLLESIRFEGGDAGRRTDDFVYNLTSGTAAVIGGLESGDVYELTTVVPDDIGDEELAESTPGSADVPTLGGLPDGLAALLDAWVAGVQSPGERLASALDRLRAEGYISHGLTSDEPPSRSGHGADRIGELVTAPRMIGDDEQYAVTAALMARQLGYPSRVVFGFAPHAQDAGDGRVTVTGEDVSAWIEVHTAEHGWVAVDPVPPVRPIPEDEPEDTTPISRPQSVVPPPHEEPPIHEDQQTPESTREEPDGVDPVLAAFLLVARVTGGLLLVVAVVLAPFLLVIAAKLRRRRLRRRAATPIERIQGGWEDFADTAVDHGVTPPPAATRAEFAASIGSLPPRVLAAAVDRATFSPEGARPIDADQVWDAVDDLRLAFDHAGTPWKRLRALVSLRSLGYRRQRQRTRQGER